jgi:hypothetical protein
MAWMRTLRSTIPVMPKIVERVRRWIATERAVNELNAELHAAEAKRCEWCRGTVEPNQGVRRHDSAWCDEDHYEQYMDFVNN